jgi:hypothetical protein
MSQNYAKGTVSRQIDETQERIDKQIEKLRGVSDRVQQATDTSKQEGKS